jgi:hypothetical protein
MLHQIRIAGASGVLKVGYQVAARFKAWQLEREQMTTMAVEFDPFWITSDAPKTLSLTLGGSQWIWENVEVLATAPTFAVKVHGSPTVRR